MNRVLVFDDVGGEPGLTFTDLAQDEPGPGEISIRVHAFGLNQADILLMQGRHYVTQDLPMRLGYECCGIVDRIGEGVTAFAPGDAVSTIPNVEGPYSVAGEYALAHQDFVSPWPKGWSAAEACGFWMQYLTAYFPMRELFPLDPEDWVVITAASGGTGLGAIAMAKALSANVIATSRTSAKRQLLLDHGADAVVATEEEDLQEAILGITGGRGANLVNDTIGGPFVARYVEALAKDGKAYVHGGLSGTNEVSFPILALVHRRAAVYGYSLINETRDPQALRRGRRFVSDGIARGVLPRPVIDTVFPFDRAPEAYERMKSGEQRGKIVVQVAGDNP